MSYATDYDNLMFHFSEQWQDTTPIAWSVEDYQPSPNVAFVRIATQAGSEAQIGVCGEGGAYRNAGVLRFQVNTPRAEGKNAALELVDELTAIYRGKVIGGVVIGSIQIDDLGEISGAWYVVNIAIYYSAWRVYQ